MRTGTGFAGVIALLVVAALAEQPAAASTSVTPSPPPAAGLVVTTMTGNGAGCPTGSLATAVAPDNSAFSITYSSYRARVGVGAGPIDFRKNCQARLILQPPAGFTFGIAEVVHSGYAYLAEGARGALRAGYYPIGSPLSALVTHTFTGPMDDVWRVVDSVDIGQSYFPCGDAPIVIFPTELRVLAGTSDTATTTSLLAFDSVDGNPSSVYHLAWATC